MTNMCRGRKQGTNMGKSVKLTNLKDHGYTSLCRKDDNEQPYMEELNSMSRHIRFIGGILLISVLITALLGTGLSMAEGSENAIRVTEIMLSEKELQIPLGTQADLTVTVMPENVTNSKVEWSSSDETVATVQKGRIKGVTAGKCDITCKATDDSGVEAVCHVKVVIPVKGITPNEKQVILLVGATDELATAMLTYTVSPEDAYWQNVTWESSNEEIVEVGTDGTVKGKVPGKAVVTVYTTQPDSKVKAQIQITVQQAITGIELDTKKLSIPVRKNAPIKATVAPENATNKKLTWTSSDESIAKVNAQGTVTGVSAGKAQITATAVDGTEVAATCEVTVFVPVSKVTINEGRQYAVPAGLTHTFTATVVPEDATNRGLVWTSSDETVATVDQNGTVTGVSFGKATITATASDGSNVVGTIAIVINKAIESIIPETEQVNIPITRNVVLKPTIEPADAGNKTLEWSSSDESIASVTKEGKVTGVSKGEATVTVKASDGSGVEATYKVTVVVPVQRITLSEPKPFNLPVDVTRLVTATVEPAEADIKDVVWSSSDERIATVNEYGEISGISKGNVIITAAATDGSNVKSTVKVSVDEYDLVFLTKSSQSAQYGYGSGMYTVKGRTRSGCVSIPSFGEGRLVLIGRKIEKESFNVKPLKPGTDVITITAGSTRTTITVYVSPACDFEDNERRVEEYKTSDMEKVHESRNTVPEEPEEKIIEPYRFTYEHDLYSDNKNMNTIEWDTNPQDFPLEFMYRTEIEPGQMMLWGTRQKAEGKDSGVVIENENDAIKFNGIPVGNYRAYFLYPFTSDGQLEKDSEKAQFYMVVLTPYETSYNYDKVTKLIEKFTSEYGDPEIGADGEMSIYTWNCPEDTGICITASIDEKQKKVSELMIYLGKTGYDKLIRSGK